MATTSEEIRSRDVAREGGEHRPFYFAKASVCRCSPVSAFTPSAASVSGTDGVHLTQQLFWENQST